MLPIDRFIWFGQLADQYFASVRGACMAYLIRVDLYRPKIPWWEWVQDVVDIWDPAPGREGARGGAEGTVARSHRGRS
jgi:hypothetical protein